MMSVISPPASSSYNCRNSTCLGYKQLIWLESQQQAMDKFRLPFTTCHQHRAGDASVSPAPCWRCLSVTSTVLEMPQCHQHRAGDASVSPAPCWRRLSVTSTVLEMPQCLPLTVLVTLRRLQHGAGYSEVLLTLRHLQHGAGDTEASPARCWLL